MEAKQLLLATAALLCCSFCCDVAAAASDCPKQKDCYVTDSLSTYTYTFKSACNGSCSKTDCALPGTSCSNSLKCCSRTEVSLRKGKAYVQESTGIKSATIECINSKCVGCIPDKGICSNTSGIDSIYTCCSELRDSNTKVQCQHDRKRIRACTATNACESKYAKEAVSLLSCSLPLIKDRRSSTLCFCPNVKTEKESVKDLVGYRCKGTKCEASCRFIGGSCMVDADCCDFSNCNKETGKCVRCYDRSDASYDSVGECNKQANCCARLGCANAGRGRNSCINEGD